MFVFLVATWLLTNCLCVLTGDVGSNLVSVRAKTSTSDPKGVKLQLETTFLFNKEDANMTLIDNVRQFIDVLQTSIGQKAEFRSQDDNTVLTDFLDKLVHIIVTYKDNDLKTLAKAFNFLIVSYNSFEEIFPDENMKYYVKNSVYEWTETELKQLRRKLLFFIKRDYSASVSDFLKYLNKYFDVKDARKLNNTLHTFENLPKSLKEVTSVVKNAIDFIVFNRYNKLNEISKEELTAELNKLSQTLNFKKLQKDSETAFYKRSYPVISRRMDKLKRFYRNEEELHEITQNSGEKRGREEELSDNNMFIFKNLEIFVMGPNETLKTTTSDYN